MDEIRSTDGNKIKKKHPMEKANLISRLFFCWLLPYFVKGFKRELNEDDMYGPLRTHEAMRLGDKLQKAWDYEVANKKDPSLWMAILRVFSQKLIIYGIFYIFIELVVK